MRLFNIIYLIFFIALDLCAYSQPEIKWGDSVLGIQLSITITNGMLDSQCTNSTIQCRIRNSSTNPISLAHSLILPDNTHLFLISHSGQIIELTPNRILVSRIAGKI